MSPYPIGLPYRNCRIQVNDLSYRVLLYKLQATRKCARRCCWLFALKTTRQLNSVFTVALITRLTASHEYFVFVQQLKLD